MTATNQIKYEPRTWVWDGEFMFPGYYTWDSANATWVLYRSPKKRKRAQQAMTKIALVGAAILTMASPVQSADVDQITRQIGLEILRERMIEHNRSINWTPPGYFNIGFVVRVG